MERGPMALFGAIVAVGLGPALWLGAQFGRLDAPPPVPPASVSEQHPGSEQLLGGSGAGDNAVDDTATVIPTTPRAHDVPLHRGRSTKPSASSSADPDASPSPSASESSEPTKSSDPSASTGESTGPSTGGGHPSGGPSSVPPSPPASGGSGDGDGTGSGGNDSDDSTSPNRYLAAG
jgi:hypothetical protein